MERTEWLERDAGKPRLAFSIAAPAGEPLGAILITHGFAEHSQSYAHVIARWTERGFVVASYDCRGHGRSEGVPAHVDDYRDYVVDLEDVLTALRKDPRWAAFDRPILFGHSTGCLASILVAARRQRAFSGLGLSSPYLELAVPVSPMKKWFARVVANVYPEYSEGNRLDPVLLTREPQFAAKIAADPLRLRKVTAGWFVQTELGQIAAFDAAPGLELPVFCMVGGEDGVARPEAGRRWFDKLASEDKTFRIVPHGRHEVLNDIGYEAHADLYAEHFQRWVSNASAARASAE